MGKKRIPSRQQYHKKKENKFIDMPKDQLIKVCVITGVVILAIVLFFVLRDKFDGHLDVVDNLPVTQSDDWIVANTGTSGAPRYYKIGTVGEVEGYTREYVPATLTQQFTPADASLGAITSRVMAINGEYDIVIENLHQNFSTTMVSFNGLVGELRETTVGENPAGEFYYSYSFPQTNPETGEATGASNYTRGYYVCLKASRGQSVVVSAESSGTDEAALATEEVLRNEAVKVAQAVSVDK